MAEGGDGEVCQMAWFFYMFYFEHSKHITAMQTGIKPPRCPALPPELPATPWILRWVSGDPSAGTTADLLLCFISSRIYIHNIYIHFTCVYLLKHITDKEVTVLSVFVKHHPRQIDVISDICDG